MEFSEFWPSKRDGYEIIGEISRGACADIYVAEVKVGPYAGLKVALKSMNLEQFEDSFLTQVMQEFFISKVTPHPNLLNNHVCFSVGKYLCLVMPFMNLGSLSRIIKSDFPTGIRDKVLLASLLKCILEGIAYFHNAGNIHRDIKPSNMLVNTEGEISLADFGVSTRVSFGCKRNTLIGTAMYMAPEVLEEGLGYSAEADI